MTAEPLGMLNHIKIEGFKSIKSLNLPLKPLNVLVGANGAGKSNFIQFFRLVKAFAEGQLDRFVTQQGGADCLLYFGSKETEHLSFKFRLPSSSYQLTLMPTVKDNLKQAYSGGSGSRLEETEFPRPFDFVEKYVKNLRVYHFHDTSESAKVKKTASLVNSASLMDDASNLAAFLYRLKTVEAYQSAYQDIISAIKRVAPYFDDFVLQPEEANEKTILLKWQHMGRDNLFSADQLSDGTLRFICLAALFLQPTKLLPRTIIIDEPELGLHPYAIQLLAGMMKSCSARTQVIAATQSVTLLNQFTFEDLIVVDRVGDESVFKRPTKEEAATWMEDYGLGDLWERNWLGGTP